MSRIALNVHLLPALFAPEEVAGGAVVIVDILRASTTMTTALANGAREVIPCLTVEEALKVREQSGPGKSLLGGERGGVKIESFDFGNSPRDYTPEVVANKTLGFTTTNGTKALHHSQQADRILIGCFSNLSSVVSCLNASSGNIHIVCAGTNGAITSEDVLFAGCLADRLLREFEESPALSDSARLAIDHWNACCPDSGFDQIHEAIRLSQGGRNLIELGYDADLEFVSQIDRIQGVAELKAGRLSWVPSENKT